MRNILFVVAVLFISVVGCSDRSAQNVSKKIKLGAKIEPFTLPDQFEKSHTLTKDIKKIIFVFQKATGHLVKEFFNKKPVDFLEKKDAIFVADISKMPSIIYTMFAKSDLQKHKYPIWLIFDKNISAKYKKEDKEDKIMVVNLDNLIVTNVKFISTLEELNAIFK